MHSSQFWIIIELENTMQKLSCSNNFHNEFQLNNQEAAKKYISKGCFFEAIKAKFPIEQNKLNNDNCKYM